MPPRTTSSGSSAPPLTGVDFLNEYAQRMKSLFDAAAFPLTSVGGTGNAVTASLDPPLDAGGLVNGMKFTITWGAANTGAVTLAINGGTAVPVVDADNVALPASALASGRRSLIEFVGGSFRILSSAGGGAAGGGPTYQAFSASGTWTRPTGYDPDTSVLIECWGGGGGGGPGSGVLNATGGGGGGYNKRLMRIADLPSSVSVTIGSGGASGAAGGATSFGSILSAFGGGPGSSGGGLGGGGGGEVAAGINGTGGNVGGANSTATTVVPNALTIFGGGGGGGISGSTPTQGGSAVYGGGGGGSRSAGAASVGGASIHGGSGANAPTSGNGNAGFAPGGGGSGAGALGGSGGPGARGECRITILG